MHLSLVQACFVWLIQVTDWCVDTSGQKQAITQGKLNACGKNILHVGKQRCLAPLRLQGERAVPLSENRKLGTNGMPKTSSTSFDYIDDVRDIIESLLVSVSRERSETPMHTATRR